MKPTRVAAVSISSRFGRVDENVERLIGFVDQAAKQRADLVCFPEVCVQGYHTDVDLMRREAQAADGPVCRRLVVAAKEHQLVVSAGMAFRDRNKVYNAQVFLGPEGLLGFAAKVHLCGIELEMFDPGEDWPVVDLGFARVGTVICYDAELPEAARCLALGGADVIIMSFATGRCDSCGRPQDPLAWPDQAQRWAPARAYENRVFVVGVNHAGNVIDEDRIAGASWVEAGALHRWPGYSFAVSPSGELIDGSARDHNDERMLVVDLDPATLAHWRVAVGDFLKARRPETYGRLTLQGATQCPSTPIPTSRP